MNCPRGCGEETPTASYLAAHLQHVHGRDRDAAERQANEAFTAAVPLPPKESEPMKKPRICGKCGKDGHNARRCGKAESAPKAAKPVKAKEPTRVSRNGHGDPIVTAIDAKIGALRSQITALEAAKAALA